MRHVTMICALLLAGPLAAAAQERIDERRPASATGRVEVVNTSGTVRVTGWDRNEVQVTGTLGRGSERLEFEQDGDLVRIRVVLPRNARNVQGSDLNVRIPARRDVNVRTVSADITTDAVAGRVTLQSVSGTLELSGSPSEVSARTISGRLNANVATGRLHAASVSGDVRLRGTAQQGVEAEAVSGDVSVQMRTPQIRAQAVSGDVQVDGTAERVRVNSVSGDVRLTGDSYRGLDVETVSGDVRVTGGLQRAATLNVQSHSGRVELRLPADVSADFEVRSFSGRIQNAFGPQAERTGRHTPQSELRFALGQGGARVSVRTFSGDVVLARN